MTRSLELLPLWTKMVALGRRRQVQAGIRQPGIEVRHRA